MYRCCVCCSELVRSLLPTLENTVKPSGGSCWLARTGDELDPLLDSLLTLVGCLLDEYGSNELEELVLAVEEVDLREDHVVLVTLLEERLLLGPELGDRLLQSPVRGHFGVGYGGEGRHYGTQRGWLFFFQNELRE